MQASRVILIIHDACAVITDDVNVAMLGVATSKCRRSVNQMMNDNPFV